MVILIFSVVFSVGTGVYIPDPDLIETGLSLPFSVSTSGKIGRFNLYSTLNIVPVGDQDYDLDFYLLDVGLTSRIGILEGRLGGGLGRIRRAIGTNAEKGFCYDFTTGLGPRFPINDFALYPFLGFRLISDAESHTWIFGLGLEVGYEIH